MEIRLRWYKRRLRIAYERRQQMLDQADCGYELLKHLSSRFSALDAEVERLMAKCQELDKFFE